MNNTNNSKASDWIETSVDERHALGKVLGHKRKLGDSNDRGMYDLKVKKFRETMRVRKLHLLCLPETKKR